MEVELVALRLAMSSWCNSIERWWSAASLKRTVSATAAIATVAASVAVVATEACIWVSRVTSESPPIDRAPVDVVWTEEASVGGESVLLWTSLFAKESTP